MNKVKVLVVDDSAFMRKLITEFLTSDPRIEVVGTARNGKEAVDKSRVLRPDCITMDVEMPEMNGLEALQEIMKTNPVPVVMLSSITSEGAESTIIAMQNGAFDFIQKPSGSISIDLYKVKHDIINKIIAASRANITSLKKVKKNNAVVIPTPIKYSNIELGDNSSLSKKIICIGTSTGGPRALQEVLTNLPKNIDAPILVVQHMPPGFTLSLANRLNTLSQIQVKEAENGEILKPGTAYIAPGGFHLKVKRIGTALAVQIDQSEPENGHRPAVDALFRSVSELTDYKKIAVVMTGMGSDGSIGLKRLKESGKVVAIAESKETSIVFGMPKAAIETQVVDAVEPLQNIADSIIKYTQR